MKKTLPILLFLFLGGCALPLPFQITSWVLDGVSYIATDKSITDHGISMVMNRDCSLLRIFTKGEICSDEDYIGFAAIFRDFNGTDDATPAIASLPARPTIPATGNYTVEVASDDDIELASFVTASGFSDSPTHPSVTYVVKQDVNIRAEPTGAADIKRVALKNESIKCLDEKNGWRMVELSTNANGNTIYGWIDGNYLEPYIVRKGRLSGINRLQNNSREKV